MGILIAAAYPLEFKAAAEYFKLSTYADNGISFASDKKYTVVNSGTDYNDIHERILYAVEKYNPDIIIDSGICGALKDDIDINTIMVMNRVFLCRDLKSPSIQDSLSCHKWESPGDAADKVDCVTVTEAVLNSETRVKLHEIYGALSCNMETYWILKVLENVDIKKYSIRVVSDNANENTKRVWKTALHEKFELLYSFIGKNF